jgi:cell wall assembly regulator SMI1
MQTFEDLKWDGVGQPLADEELRKIERTLQVELPDDFRRCFQRFHGARPSIDSFNVSSPDGRTWGSGFAMLLNADSSSSDSVVVTYNDMEEVGEPRIVPFGTDGGGDHVCLDFRSGGVPPVCYYSHEDGEFYPLAASFAEFCALLVG